MTVVKVLGRVDKLTDGTDHSVDSTAGAPICPYRNPRLTLPGMRTIAFAALVLACAVRTANGDPIHDAVTAGDVGRVVQILRTNPSALYADTAAGGSPFRLAALLADVGVMQALLDAGGNINRTDSTGEAPLHAAAGNGGYPGNYLDALQFLLNRGADVNVRSTKDGRMPLHTAVERGQPNIIPVLLARGASVVARDQGGNTPLLLVEEKWHRPKLVIVKLLVEKGADPNASDLGRYTILHKMAVSGFAYTWPEARVGSGGAFPDMRQAISETLQVTEYLVSHGARVDARTDHGLTPLFFAAGKEKPELVELLIRLGADVRARDQFGRTALKFARQGGRNAESIAILLRYGATE
jgi:ankyrin repeat protein